MSDEPESIEEGAPFDMTEGLELVEEVGYPKIMEPIYQWVREAFNGDIETPLLDAAVEVRENLESFRDSLEDMAEATQDAETAEQLLALADEV